MADPHSTDAAPVGASHVDPERDAKVDELLLAGLEHYFAGRYQEAINIWGRVLFIDRGHARARAYIERARSAQAERQRRTEELVHEGVAAIQRGDGDAARELLESAAAQGDRPDVAMAYLERLERLAGAVGSAAGGPEAAPRPDTPPRALAPRRFRVRTPAPVRVLPLIGVAILVGAVMIVAASYDLLKPLVDVSWRRPASGPAVTVPPDLLPAPRAATMAIARARSLFGAGRLRDGLAQLDRIPPGDPSFTEADQLRSEIQRRLLEAAGLGVAPAQPPPRGFRE
jgi:tetratricopeptide (TPR) repeat protein